MGRALSLVCGGERGFRGVNGFGWGGDVDAAVPYAAGRWIVCLSITVCRAAVERFLLWLVPVTFKLLIISISIIVVIVKDISQLVRQVPKPIRLRR